MSEKGQTDDERVSFILYKSYAGQIKLLSDEQAGKLIKAVFDYACTETMQEQDDLTLKVMLLAICNQLDIDARKYTEKIERRREAGRKGGLQKAKNQAEASKARNTVANLADKEEEREIENEIENEKEIGIAEEIENEEDKDQETEKTINENTNLNTSINTISTANADTNSNTTVKPKVNTNANTISNSKPNTISTAKPNTAANTNSAATAAKQTVYHGGSGGDLDAAGALKPQIIFYTKNQYPTTQQELDKCSALAAELFTQYCGKSPGAYDVERVFHYVHNQIPQGNGTYIAGYDEQKAALLRYAFEAAMKGGKVSWSYISGIYSNFEKRGIKTVMDANLYEWERKNGSLKGVLNL